MMAMKIGRGMAAELEYELKIKGGGAEMEFDRKSLKEIEKST